MTDTLDKARIEERYGHLFGKVDGAMTCVLGYVGDKLGLYAALAEHGPTTSADLAKATSLHERWVREWLCQQTAAGVVTFEEGRFLLDAEAAEIYGTEESGVFGAGIFELMHGLIHSADRLEESFRTGLGEPYDAFGADTARGIERMMGPFFRSRLVPDVLPALEGVEEKLRRGAKVADIGCGAGVALEVMAREYPQSQFHGFDNSRVALGRAQRRAAELPNLTIHDTTHKRLEEDGSYDLITTFDCIHDMTHPTETIGAIRRSIKQDGTWFVADVHGAGSFEKNLEEQPFAAMFYGFSVVCCMRAALSTPDGEGLGTLGFHEAVARSMAAEAGFSRFEKHDFENPINDYYEIRP
ncbi:MAG: class I SAM-dependent methyltransferase [Planctomycetota bacterium]|jgi:2-polyprenyl-3-methyl-5-hydroxy-6-metoxy-1,4-benzoquinol methylase